MRISELVLKPIKPKPLMTPSQARIQGMKNNVKRSQQQLKTERERQHQQREAERRRKDAHQRSGGI